jgi:hypothetical protein
VSYSRITYIFSVIALRTLYIHFFFSERVSSISHFMGMAAHINWANYEEEKKLIGREISGV